ncbi:MAG: MIP family channel protein [Acidipila sp.]|nr:MIP family channel protein [Acidipila sp.]
MYNTPQKLVAEFVGTFTWVFAGVAVICSNQLAGGGSGLIGVALAQGLAVALMVAATSHISGAHFNPAVTAALWVTKRMGTLEVAGYWIAQLAGATAAAYLVTVIFPPEVWRHVSLGTPSLAVDVTPTLGMLIEAVLTFLLVFVFFGVAIDKNSGFNNLAPFAIGLTVTLAILACGVLTGAAINPARAFGPALAAHAWASHAVYWVGPLAGSITGGFLYDTLLMKKTA